jgi:signal transduction histidine kinase/CheY-like chemotaxis protein
MFATPFWLLLLGSADSEPPTLSTVHEVRELAPRAVGQPVHLRGTVTFAPPPHNYFYLQDKTGGVRVEWDKCDLELKLGDAVEVMGRADVGLFLPKVRADTVTVAAGSRDRLPVPERFNLTSEEAPYLDGQWVATEAVVQNAWVPAGPWLKVDLARGRGNVVAYLPRPLAVDTEKVLALRGAVVRVRGVWERGRGGSSPSHLLVTDADEFESVALPQAPELLPLVTAQDLNHPRPDPISARLPVRIEGVITLNQNSRDLFAQDATGVVHIRFCEAVALRPGQRIVALGFPRADGTTDPPLVESARLLAQRPEQPVEGLELPPPEPGTVADAAAGKLDGRVVRFVGLVHAVENPGDRQVLTILSEKLTFAVVMERPVPELEPGSRVEVVGVVTREQFAQFPRHTFAVVARADGLRVLAGPPAAPQPGPPEAPVGWGGRRVVYLSAGFLGLFVLAGATVTALRVQVRRARELARKRTEEKKQLEGQLDRASRLEAVGRVVGGVAHDFNNILTVINGCAQLLDEGAAADPRRAATLADIRRAGRMAVVLTRLLLAFSRERRVPPHALDVNALVADAEPVLARLLGPRTVLRVAPDPTVPLALAETGRVLQIMINLAVNAAEAMPVGGTFTLATGAPEPGWVRLTATDTGTGMSAEVKARAFERGFTTKAGGTGTGLATVYDAVRELGGRLRFRSELGHGTEFEIDLPAAPPDREALLDTLVVAECDRPTVELRTDITPPPRLVPGAPVALLVEDDDAVRSYVRLVLERAGVAVISSAEPEEALRALTGCGPISLLVTDVVLPGLSGQELAARVRAQCPGVRVLFMSGEPSDEEPAPGDFLHKPFSPHQLTEQVRRLLDQTA